MCLYPVLDFDALDGQCSKPGQDDSEILRVDQEPRVSVESQFSNASGAASYAVAPQRSREWKRGYDGDPEEASQRASASRASRVLSRRRDACDTQPGHTRNKGGISR